MHPDGLSSARCLGNKGHIGLAFNDGGQPLAQERGGSFISIVRFYRNYNPYAPAAAVAITGLELLHFHRRGAYSDVGQVGRVAQQADGVRETREIDLEHSNTPVDSWLVPGNDQSLPTAGMP